MRYPNFDITVPADDLAPLGARSSAGTVLTYSMSLPSLQRERDYLREDEVQYQPYRHPANIEL